MSSQRVRAAAVELAWSVFTELGVPGVARHHAHTAIDPEPWLVVAPSLFALEPRLRDQVYGWCATHGSMVSVSRLKGLLKSLAPATQAAFGDFSTTLEENTALRWPNLGRTTPWTSTPTSGGPRLPLERASLLRLRLRALCGVGVRTDVLCELLSVDQRWTRASELTDLGYSKRAVALVLADLTQARFAEMRRVGNVNCYRLREPAAYGDIAGPLPSSYPRWRAILLLLLTALRLAELEEKPDTVRRVEAVKRREQLATFAVEAEWPAPPEVRGAPQAWELVVTWSADVFEQFATGGAPPRSR